MDLFHDGDDDDDAFEFLFLANQGGTRMRLVCGCHIWNMTCTTFFCLRMNDMHNLSWKFRGCFGSILKEGLRLKWPLMFLVKIGSNSNGMVHLFLALIIGKWCKKFLGLLYNIQFFIWLISCAIFITGSLIFNISQPSQTLFFIDIILILILLFITLSLSEIFSLDSHTSSKAHLFI